MSSQIDRTSTNNDATSQGGASQGPTQTKMKLKRLKYQKNQNEIQSSASKLSNKGPDSEGPMSIDR